MENSESPAGSSKSVSSLKPMDLESCSSAEREDENEEEQEQNRDDFLGRSSVVRQGEEQDRDEICSQPTTADLSITTVSRYRQSPCHSSKARSSISGALSPKLRTISTDNRLFMEFQLLDALDKSNMTLKRPNYPNSCTPSRSIESLSESCANSTRHHSRSHLDKEWTIQQILPLTNTSPPPRVSSLGPVKDIETASEEPLVKPSSTTGRSKRIIYWSLFLGHLVLIFVGIFLYIFIFDKCSLFGCSEKTVYDQLSSTIFRREGNQTNAIFDLNSLEHFPRVQEITRLLLSTLPRDSANSSSSDSFVLKNILPFSADNLHFNLKYAPVSSTFMKWVLPEDAMETFSFGIPFCGTDKTPILGFLSSPNSQNAYFKEYQDFGFQSSNITSSDHNDEVLCCVDFVYRSSQINPMITANDVHARVICQNDAAQGGFWKGIQSIVRVPKESWLTKVHTSEYLHRGSDSLLDHISTIIGISTLSDKSWPRGISLTTKVAMPKDLLEPFPNILKSHVNHFIDGTLSGIIPFDNTENLFGNSSRFNLLISADYLDSSKIVPSPWLYDRVHYFAIDLPLVPSDTDQIRIALGGQWVYFLKSCPIGYLEVNGGCWRRGDKMQIRHSVHRDNSFVDPMDGIFKTATIARFTYSLDEDFSVGISRPLLSFKVRTSDTSKISAEKIGRIFILNDGTANDNFVESESGSSLKSVSYSSLAISTLDGGYRKGGDWIEIIWSKGVPGPSSWDQIPSFQLRTSLLTKAVILAFLPSKEFVGSSTDLQILVSSSQVPPVISEPIEISIGNLNGQQWDWKPLVRTHTLLQTLVTSAFDQLSNENITSFPMTFDHDSSVDSGNNVHTVLLDSIEMSDDTAPSKDMPRHHYLPNYAGTFEFFQLSSDSPSELKQGDKKVRKNTQPYSNSSLITDYQITSQRLLQDIRELLHSSLSNIQLSTFRHVLNLSLHVRNTILKTGHKDIPVARLKRQLESLSQPFFAKLQPLVDSVSPSFFRFIKTWIMDTSSINARIIPTPLRAAYKNLASYCQRHPHIRLVNDNPNALSTFLLLASLDASFLSKYNLTSITANNKTMTGSAALEALLSEDRGLMDNRNFKTNDPENDPVFCFGGRCDSAAEARSLYVREVLERLRLISESLSGHGHPQLFPFEIQVPKAVIKSTRSTIKQIIFASEETLNVKKKVRNRWMSWLVSEIIQHLSLTISSNLENLLSRNGTIDHIHYNSISLLPTMVATANLPLVVPDESWTLLSRTEFKVLEILELVMDRSTTDERLLKELITLASYSSPLSD